jgi:1,4-dihydroxy-2-naphthoyl-CoA hydrolase
MSVWFAGAPDMAWLNAGGKASLSGHLGIEFIEVGDNWLRAKMPVDQRTRQPFGRLHGGASVALAETVASMAGAFTVDRTKFVVVGMEINANHIRPVKEGWVFGTATSESVGRTSQVWTIRIVDEADKLVCLSRITLAVIPLERS